MSNLKTLVETFYNKCLTINNDTNPSSFKKLLTDNSNQKNATRRKIKTNNWTNWNVWKIMSEIWKWKFKETIEQGNQIVAVLLVLRLSLIFRRCGDGTKIFKIIASDTIENGQIKTECIIVKNETTINQLQNK